MKKPRRHTLAGLFHYPRFLGFACAGGVAASSSAVSKYLGALSTRWRG